MALASALRSVRVWGKRQSALERAARRVASAETERLLHALAGLDALAKGIGIDDPWDAVTSTALTLSASASRCSPDAPQPSRERPRDAGVRGERARGRA